MYNGASLHFNSLDQVSDIKNSLCEKNTFVYLFLLISTYFDIENKPIIIFRPFFTREGNMLK